MNFRYVFLFGVVVSFGVFAATIDDLGFHVLINGKPAIQYCEKSNNLDSVSNTDQMDILRINLLSEKMARKNSVISGSTLYSGDVFLDSIKESSSGIVSQDKIYFRRLYVNKEMYYCVYEFENPPSIKKREGFFTNKR